MSWPDDLIRDRVQAELIDKCGKQYVGADHVWLCLRIARARPTGQLLRAALGFAGCSMPSYEPPPLPQSKKSTWTRYDAAGTTGALK